MATLETRNGIYYVTYYDPVRQRSRHFSLKTKDKKTAKDLLTVWQSKRTLYGSHAVEPSKTNNTDFNTGVDMFLARKGAIPDKTKVMYKLAAKHFTDAVGNRVIGSYSKKDYYDFRDFLDRLTFGEKKKHLSQNAKASYVRHIKILFNWFIADELYKGRNFILPIPTEEKEIQIIPEADIKKILAHFKKVSAQHEHFVNFLLYSGLRIGEALRLDWQDINLKEKWMRINNTKGARDGQRVDMIPLLPKVEEVLKKLRPKTGKVWKNWKRPDSFKAAWANMNDKIHRHYQVHSLRRTCASLLANNGTDPFALMKYLRHKDVFTTLKFYAKADINKQRDNLKFPEIVPKKSPKSKNTAK